MAQPIPCDFCAERSALFMIGNLQNGQQVATCSVDAPTAFEQLMTIVFSMQPPALEVLQPEDQQVHGGNGAAADAAPRPPDPEGEAPTPAGDNGEGEALEASADTEHTS